MTDHVFCVFFFSFSFHVFARLLKNTLSLVMMNDFFYACLIFSCNFGLRNWSIVLRVCHANDFFLDIFARQKKFHIDCGGGIYFDPCVGFYFCLCFFRGILIACVDLVILIFYASLDFLTAFGTFQGFGLFVAWKFLGHSLALLDLNSWDFFVHLRLT